jgi:hypothetical protein
VFGCINPSQRVNGAGVRGGNDKPKAREANRDEVGEVVSNAITDIFFLSVKVSQSLSPAEDDTSRRTRRRREKGRENSPKATQRSVAKDQSKNSEVSRNGSLSEWMSSRK